MVVTKPHTLLLKTYVLVITMLLSRISLAMPVNTDVLVSQHVTNASIPHFDTVSQAIAFVESHSVHADKIWTIFVEEGTYRERVVINASNLRLIGASRDQTTIVFNRYAGQTTLDRSSETWGTGRTATVEVKGKNVTLENITITNDFDYPGNEAKAKEDPTRVSGTQAVALKADVHSDQLFLNNVALWGYQDTLYLKGNRTLMQGGVVAGHIDFIFGEGTALFEDVSIVSRVRRSGDNELTGYITAPSTHLQRPYGLTFINCRLEREPGVENNSVALGRPWHPTTTFSNGRYANPFSVGKATFINTNMAGHISQERWASMAGTSPSGTKVLFNPHTEARFAEYNSHGEGSAFDVNSPELESHRLNEELASFYTKKAILGGWQPIGMK